MIVLPLSHILIFSLLLFSIGIYGALVRRNIIGILISIELMLNAANLAFVAFASHLKSLDGQIFVFFVMTVAAAEAAVGLAIIIALYRRKQTLNLDEINILKW